MKQVSNIIANTNTDESANTAKELNRQARILWENSSFSDSESLAFSALTHAQKNSDRLQEAAALLNISQNAISTGRYQVAEEYLQRAMKVSAEEDDQDGLANAIGEYASLCMYTADYQRASDYYTKALEIHEKIGDKLGIAKNSGNMGFLLSTTGDYYEAIKYLFNAHNAFEQLGDKRNIAICESALGAVYTNLSDFPSALKRFEVSLKLRQEVGDRNGIAMDYNNIAIVYFYLSDYPRAIEYYTKALSLHEQFGDKTNAATVLGNLANVYSYMRDFNFALDYSWKTLQYYEALGELHGIASALTSLGTCFASLSDFPAALKYHKQALDIFQKIGHKRGILVSTGNIGVALLNWNSEPNNAKEAEIFLSKAIAMSEDNELQKIYSEFHFYIANLYEQQKRWKKHSFHYKKYHELYVEAQSDEAKKQAELFNHKLKVQEFEHKLQLEKQTLEAENEMIRRELKHKSRELENTISQIVEKNNFLNSISNNMRLAQSAKSAEKDEMLDELLQKIRRHISSGAVTAMIYDEIESVHGEFMKRIKAQYPALTAIEVKIAALLRMKLTSANIASLLFISQRTVELHRLRIRKKMGLLKEDNLYMALAQHT